MSSLDIGVPRLTHRDLFGRLFDCIDNKCLLLVAQIREKRQADAARVVILSAWKGLGLR